MYDVKIINNNIEDNLSNKNCIYVKLDYDNPIINGKNIAYPILSAWLEKTSIDSVDELKIKMPELPDLDEYSFVNIIYYTNNTYKILILREPIRVINEKININNYEIKGIPVNHIHSASSASSEFSAIVADDIRNSNKYF